MKNLLNLSNMLVAAQLFVFFLLSPLLLVAAESTQTVLRQQANVLSQEYAAFRAQQVSNVAYQLSVAVDNNSDIFTGSVNIQFDLAANNVSPLTLDFDQGEILAIEINNNPVSWDYSQWFITLPADDLANGSNTIVISYQRPFSTDGDGLHKFTDPENGEIYLYTNFEPYNANRFFPHFDQPNLKAPFTLDVMVPGTWQVISNMRETSTTNLDGEKHWQFPATPPISSYLYSFHAGPFTVWEDQAEDIALRLFARSSLAEFVNTEEWFIPTRQFLAFFQDFYDVPYPLDKYDQIVVPDFNPGAMENIGAVTFNEAYISRGEKSVLQRSRLAYVIAHEMAHMWFGDLVTMEWWNDIWLNESFATYMGYLALEQASEFTNAWDIFYSRDKSRAYQADARVTTHPIALEASTTAEAFANFDIITYQKGSSVLKQLPYFIGEENFRRGVSNYLKANSFSNATLDDFVEALGDSANIDLSGWKEQWLQKSGANTIRPDFTCNDGRIVSMRLIQSVPEASSTDKVLRSQRTLVGLYRQSDNEMILASAIPVTYSGVVSWIPEAVGEPCPDLVLPNENDHAYFEIELDPVSRNTLSEHINKFSNPTTRLMLWEALWSSVRKAKMPLDEFTDFAFRNISAEQNDDVVRQVSGNIASAFNYYTSFGNFDEHRLAIQDFSWNELNTAEPGTEIQKIWFANFVSRAHTNEALEYLQALLDGTQTISGLEIDQDKRWDIVYTLNRYQYGEYDALLDAESRNDLSDQGVNSALATRAVRPDENNKAEFINIILNDPERYKLASMRAIIFSLFPAEQSALLEPHADRILEAFPLLNATANQRYLDTFVELAPAMCSNESVARLEQANNEIRPLLPVLSKRYQEILQEDQRCARIKALLD